MIELGATRARKSENWGLHLFTSSPPPLPPLLTTSLPPPPLHLLLITSSPSLHLSRCSSFSLCPHPSGSTCSCPHGAPVYRFEHNLLVWRKFGENSVVQSLNGPADPNALRPLDYNTFWEVVKRRKGEGLRLTHLRHPHPCDQCRTLPQFEAELKRALLELHSAVPEDKHAAGVVVAKLERMIKHRIVHRKVLDNQRSWIHGSTKRCAPSSGPDRF